MEETFFALRAGNAVVLMHARDTPSAAAFEQACAELEGDTRAVLAFAYGSASLTALHRKRLSGLVRELDCPFAAVLESRLQRLIGSALALFIPKMRVFGPHNVEKGLQYIDRLDREFTEKLVRAHAQVDIPWHGPRL